MCTENNTESKKLSRYKLREQIFLLCFEKLFNDDSFEDIIENTIDSRDLQLDKKAIETAKRIIENSEQIDSYISENLKKGWKISRLSRVSLSVMRLAVYEMLFEEKIPVSVSINEAVELAKKYSDDAPFINGVLGAIARQLPEKEQ
ncbi:MAG: transcription antitermination factor NusB [Acutalibacteraceae bacterium]